MDVNDASGFYRCHIPQAAPICADGNNVSGSCGCRILAIHPTTALAVGAGSKIVFLLDAHTITTKLAVSADWQLSG